MDWIRALLRRSPAVSAPAPAPPAAPSSSPQPQANPPAISAPAATPTPPPYEPREPLLHVGRGVGGFDLEIVGESHYQDTLWTVRTDNDTGGRWIKADFHVVPEPTNEYDADAIKVVTQEGDTVGYFSRTNAQRYKQAVAAAQGTMWCRGLLLGGDAGRESIGVKLDVLPPVELLARLTKKAPEEPAREDVAKAPPGSTKVLDPDGQPGAFINAAQRAERDVSEALGLVKGFLVDRVISDQEIQFLSEWGEQHSAAVHRWPLSALFERLGRAMADGVISDDERSDLYELFLSLVGGTVTVHLGEDGASTLPLDVPAPDIVWSESVFVFTGRFALGPRNHCSAEVLTRGGRVETAVTKRTSYLVVGTFGSRDWVQSSYGRKIQRAIELRSDGCQIRIIGEDHWAKAMAPSAGR